MDYEDEDAGSSEVLIKGKTSLKTLRPDLSKLKITNDIIDEVEELYKKMKSPGRRGQNRDKLLSYLLFHAYAELGQPKEAKDIANILNVSENLVRSSFSLFPKTSSKPVEDRVFTPFDYLHSYVEKLQLEEKCFSAIKELAEQILRSPSELQNCYPQDVASGIVLYYMKIHGCVHDLDRTVKSIGKSKQSITKILTIIGDIYNL